MSEQKATEFMRNESFKEYRLKLTTAHLTPISQPRASNCSAIWIASSLDEGKGENRRNWQVIYQLEQLNSIKYNLWKSNHD